MHIIPKQNTNKISKIKSYCRFGFALKFCVRMNPKAPVKQFFTSNVYNILTFTLEPHQRTRYKGSHAKSRLLTKCIYSGMLRLFLVQNFKENPNLQSHFGFDNYLTLYFGNMYRTYTVAMYIRAGGGLRMKVTCDINIVIAQNQCRFRVQIAWGIRIWYLFWDMNML